MTTRRLAAIPLLLLGAMIFTVTVLATIAAGLWFLYVGLRMAFAEGDIVQGLLVAFIVPMIATFIHSILSVPGNAMLALGASLWGKREAA